MAAWCQIADDESVKEEEEEEMYQRDGPHMRPRNLQTLYSNYPLASCVFTLLNFLFSSARKF